MSIENSDNKLVKAADGKQPTAPESNFGRLITHLAKDSVAAKLVTAYAAPSEATPANAMAKVATDRLDELKRNYDTSEDQKN